MSAEMKTGLGFPTNGVGLPPKPDGLTGLSSGEQQPFQSNGHSKACALCKGKNPAWTVETCFAKRHCPSGCGNQALAKKSNGAGTLFKRAPCNTCATAARKKRTERNKNEQHQDTKEELDRAYKQGISEGKSVLGKQKERRQRKTRTPPTAKKRQAEATNGPRSEQLSSQKGEWWPMPPAEVHGPRSSEFGAVVIDKRTSLGIGFFKGAGHHWGVWKNLLQLGQRADKDGAWTKDAGWGDPEAGGGPYESMRFDDNKQRECTKCTESGSKGQVEATWPHTSLRKIKQPGVSERSDHAYYRYPSELQQVKYRVICLGYLTRSLTHSLGTGPDHVPAQLHRRASL